MKDLNDYELLRLGLLDNLEAFDELFLRHREKAFSIAYSISNNKADADDIVQDAFITIYQKANTFKFESKFTSWLYRIVANTALMRRRSFKKYEASNIELVPEKPVDNSIGFKNAFKDSDFMLIRHEIREAIENAIESLPERYRLNYILREIDGLTIQEVCSHLPIAERTSKTYIKRARELMKDRLQEYLDAA